MEGCRLSKKPLRSFGGFAISLQVFVLWRFNRWQRETIRQYSLRKAASLTPNTTYTYRLVAVNAFGVSYSTIYQFTSSAGGPPGVQADTHAPAAASAAPTTAPTPAPAEATATPARRVFLPALRRCPTDGL